MSYVKFILTLFDLCCNESPKIDILILNEEILVIFIKLCWLSTMIFILCVGKNTVYFYQKLSWFNFSCQ